MGNEKVKSNIFKLDKPIGRRYFLLTVAGMIVVALLFSIVLTLSIYFLDISKFLKIAIQVIVALFYLLIFYLVVINYIKRLWDVTANKRKAIFYFVCIFAIVISMKFLPLWTFVKYIPGSLLFLICALVKGRKTHGETVK